MLASAALPPPELHRHLGDLLVTGEGADVTFQVAGETFRAHRCVVAARSPVFKAELFGAMRLRQSNAAAAIRVHDMEPQVFNALLHFVYTDSLPPEIEEGDEVAMAQHLLEAADRYVMPRLKLACEEKLCGCLSDACTAATTLVLADQHHCHSLKKACIEFLRSPHVLQAAMETDGFELIRSYPALLKELISKAVTTTEFHYSASAIVGGSVTERHLLHIERYSHAKSLPVDEYFESEPLSVGGRTWRILYHPGGTLLSDANIDHVAFVVVLHDSIPEPAHAETRFLLLDRAGNEMPVHTQTGGMREYMEDDDTTCFSVERKFVEAPECLADDCFKIRLDICVSVGFRTENRNMLGSSSSMPPSDLGQHLGDLLLETKDGADVTFQVADETFRAHRCVVAARSPVLKNELFCAMRWGRRSSTAAEVCIRIHDVAPRVFGALLYFLYTDSLPPEMAGRLAVAEEEEVVTVQRLLEAADRFDMPRLKLTCEEKLCRCLDARTVATTIELAGRHRCRGLEKACVDFLRCPHVLNAVMATYGYGPQLIRNYLSL
ncbi:hypothetical protein PR202_gb08365 [Eleusine coracana subsp. coracana]|uniref:BTB domain-containing protein n=1 Tax=Eleusine coracana subsp. coracana TaxID=191504 RepID=A0AAV5EDQ8_ELECO|nr:hypothetical protein PR202_gb08365 [Eleusine coracana subsp. coracana]